MGFPGAGETATSGETAADEAEEASEDESIVHHCASVGDEEVGFCVHVIFIIG